MSEAQVILESVSRGKTEEPTYSFRWRCQGWDRVLQQRWRVVTFQKDGPRFESDEWRDVPLVDEDE